MRAAAASGQSHNHSYTGPFAAHLRAVRQVKVIENSYIDRGRERPAIQALHFILEICPCRS
jgi:hypothetical protein